jgi:amidohydrolase
MTTLKDSIGQAVATQAETLIEVSHDIHRHPEVAFEEVHAHGVLTDVLAEAGFDVTRSAYGLDTGFRAEAVTGDGPTIVFTCEYDALPEIGHACGHNIIAAAGVGAAIATARSTGSESGGRVVVLGTPAEEGGGGKVYMIERGAFDGADAALMVHPAGRDLTDMTTVAIERTRVEYQGLAAHAAAAPHLGRNALDAAVLGYMNVAALRQHLPRSERVHGIITNGGTRPNIVPELAEAEWYMRSPTLEGLNTLVERVFSCLNAGATASACGMTRGPIGRVYYDMVTNGTLLAEYVASAAEFGRIVALPSEDTSVVGSTDMGNVSHVVPSIHPLVQAGPSDVSLHTRSFTEYAAGPEGDQAVLHGAASLALTAARLMGSKDLMDAVSGEFRGWSVAKQAAPVGS